jgi:hypothetical protein
VYRPPPSKGNRFKTTDFLLEVEQLFAELVTTPLDLCILGDFNLHMDNMADGHVAKFMTLLDGFGFQQHVNTTTHRNGHILDLVISRTSSDTVMQVDVHNDELSDHFSVNCTLAVGQGITSSGCMNIRKLKKVDPSAFTRDLATTLSQADPSAGIESMVSKYDSVITTTLDTHAPMQDICIKAGMRKNWYNDTIHHERQVRRRLERKLKKSGLEVHKQMYIDQRRVVADLVDHAKSQYYQDKFDSANTKTTFKLVNNLLNQNTSSPLPSSSSNVQLAQDFVVYFDEKVKKIQSEFDSTISMPESPHPTSSPSGICAMDSFTPVSEEEVRRVIICSPTKSCGLDPMPTWFLKQPVVLDVLIPLITSCVNTSLSSGCMPQSLKSAVITPLLKKAGLDVNNMKNYRPVSNLSFMSKVIERVVVKQLLEHMQRNRLLDPLQSAYRAGHSTETALIKVKDDINMAMDKGEGALLLLLDLSAAFDTVDHLILQHRLESHIGIKNSALKWFKSYLENRTQVVSVGGEMSKEIKLETGVPQGSVLGPILFLIYVLPLQQLIEHHLFRRHGYADDLQLYKTFQLNSALSLQQAITTLETCVKEVKQWKLKNKLKFNDSKTVLLVIAPRHHMARLSLSDLFIQVGDAVITPTKSTPNLGGIFDSTMDMIPQVASVTRSMYFNIHRISKIKCHLNQETSAKAINALVTSRLDYQNALLINLPETTIAPLQRAQNSAARLLSGSSRRDHITPVLQSLHWLPVRKRIIYKILTLVYKALYHQSAPAYMKESLSLYKPSRNLRSASTPMLLHIPRTNKTFGSQAFSAAAPKLWNELPSSLRLSASLDTFKLHLKTFLFD